MSRRKGELFIVGRERAQQCDLCGAIEELRPYGPHGEMVCFDCGMKDEGATRRAFGQATAGVRAVIVEDPDHDR